jgi:hypothetical protein
LLVALDDALGSSDGLARILAGVASRPPLAEEVPALVERDLDRSEPLELATRQRLARVCSLQRVLFVAQLADARHDLQIVHAVILSAGSSISSIVSADMSESCSHLDQVADVSPSSDGCEDCLRMGGRWVHLRMCMSCGHVGCCDNSPNRHATAHFHAEDHPLIQSYEPGEEWWYCYLDDLAFEVDGAPSFAHP